MIRREDGPSRPASRWRWILLVLLALAIGVLGLAWMLGGPVAMQQIGQEIAAQAGSDTASPAARQVGK